MQGMCSTELYLYALNSQETTQMVDTHETIIDVKDNVQTQRALMEHPKVQSTAVGISLEDSSPHMVYINV